ncbi:hypothetical protein THRCLA_10518 [Thraustotheca clavata]|uniref:CKK domain-containing protein n=1 Tax=Thraustotheca clavata TaxID=74557 RepID=A0A1V9YM03_9STRA|nr:hypothetical protein THRCLA_10518 [Thraustotheca clavata]
MKKPVLTIEAQINASLAFANEALQIPVPSSTHFKKETLSPWVVHAHHCGLNHITSTSCNSLASLLENTNFDIIILPSVISKCTITTLLPALESILKLTRGHASCIHLVFAALVMVVWLPPLDKILLYVCPAKVKVFKTIDELVSKLDEHVSKDESCAIYTLVAGTSPLAKSSHLNSHLNQTLTNVSRVSIEPSPEHILEATNNWKNSDESVLVVSEMNADITRGQYLNQDATFTHQNGVLGVVKKFDTLPKLDFSCNQLHASSDNSEISGLLAGASNSKFRSMQTNRGAMDCPQHIDATSPSNIVESQNVSSPIIYSVVLDDNQNNDGDQVITRTSDNDIKLGEIKKCSPLAQEMVNEELTLPSIDRKLILSPRVVLDRSTTNNFDYRAKLGEMVWKQLDHQAENLRNRAENKSQLRHSTSSAFPASLSKPGGKLCENASYMKIANKLNEVTEDDQVPSLPATTSTNQPQAIINAESISKRNDPADCMEVEQISYRSEDESGLVIQEAKVTNPGMAPPPNLNQGNNLQQQSLEPLHKMSDSETTNSILTIPAIPASPPIHPENDLLRQSCDPQKEIVEDKPSIPLLQTDLSVMFEQLPLIRHELPAQQYLFSPSDVHSTPTLDALVLKHSASISTSTRKPMNIKPLTSRYNEIVQKPSIFNFLHFSEPLPDKPPPKSKMSFQDVRALRQVIEGKILKEEDNIRLPEQSNIHNVQASQAVNTISDSNNLGPALQVSPQKQVFPIVVESNVVEKSPTILPAPPVPPRTRKPPPPPLQSTEFFSPPPSPPRFSPQSRYQKVTSQSPTAKSPMPQPSPPKFLIPAQHQEMSAQKSSPFSQPSPPTQHKEVSLGLSQEKSPIPLPSPSKYSLSVEVKFLTSGSAAMSQQALPSLANIYSSDLEKGQNSCSSKFMELQTELLSPPKSPHSRKESTITKQNTPFPQSYLPSPDLSPLHQQDMLRPAHRQEATSISPEPLPVLDPMFDVAIGPAKPRELKLKELRDKKLQQIQQRRQQIVSRTVQNDPKIAASKPSNRQLIQNAIEYTLLAGTACEKEREKVLNLLLEHKSENWIILIKGSSVQDIKMTFRGLYTFDITLDVVQRVYGQGPQQLQSSSIKQFFRYNSGKKNFTPVSTRSFTATTDAVALPDEYYRSSKKKSNYL